jgi:hypothetical protein
MPSKAEERWKRLAAMGAKGVIPIPEGDTFPRRSYWIPGSYAPTLSEKGNSFLSLLKNKGFRKESMTKGGLDAIGTSTTLESNKSLAGRHQCGAGDRDLQGWCVRGHNARAAATGSWPPHCHSRGL